MARTAASWSRQLARTTAIALAAGSVAGCSGAEPGDLESPDVIWPTTNPTSQWDSSPYVEAVRNGNFEKAVAWNNLDYTDADLIDTWGYEGAVEISERAQDLFRDYYYDFDIDKGADPSPYLAEGPAVFWVIDLEEADDGSSALLDMCHLPDTPEYHDKVERGRYRVTLHDDGTSTIEGERLSFDELNADPGPCDDVELELGQFDPAPEPVASPAPENIRMPLPSEAYE